MEPNRLIVIILLRESIENVPVAILQELLLRITLMPNAQEPQLTHRQKLEMTFALHTTLVTFGAK